MVEIPNYMAYKGHKKAMYSEVLGGGDIVQELNLTPSGSSTAFAVKGKTA